MDNFKNLKEDKDLFPYEYGVKDYGYMRESVFSLLRRQELASNFDLILKHMEKVGFEFFSPGGSFKRKLIVYLSQYMNYQIRFPRAGNYLLWVIIVIIVQIVVIGDL